MRLPGTRYQEHGWEQVRKLLGQCSLQAFARCDPALLLDPAQEIATLALYVDLTAEALRSAARSARAEAPGNSYGDSVAELALTLVYELQARPADWSALCAACASEYRKLGPFWRGPGADAILRKKVNDMYAVLRDKVDSDNYQVACGRSCSPNRIYAYRMLDTAFGEIARLFSAWEQNAGQVAAILGRAVGGVPIEVRQMQSIAGCKAEWVMRWSESLERFSGSPGPLHTRSKRFASLKNSVDKIGAMLREIGEYEELSANRDQDWLLDAGEATAWLDDYWRVLNESAQAGHPGPDQILEEEEAEVEEEAADEATPPVEIPADQAPAPADAADACLDECVDNPAPGLSLPPRFVELAQAAQDRGSWTVRIFGQDALPVRLAVYLKLLGPGDESYPAEWLDPATAELPTMQQLARLAQVSLPTLRKRRDAAILRLHAAARP